MRSVRRSFTAFPVVFLVLGWALPAWAQTLSRGPYLQQGNQNSVVVRWRTGTAANSRVRIGTTLVNPLPTIIDSSTSTTEHVVPITGLSADTRYYYSVGSTTATLAGPDANHFFVTSPMPGTAKPTRVWVLGDAGTGSTSQTAVRDAYTAYTGTRHTDLWLMLGDNAYSTGTDSEYTSKLFNVYPAMLRKSVLWATMGNHDGASADSISQTGPYYDQHTFPKNGESGGIASGTEAYYSFDYGNVHFICLESYDILTSTTAKNAMRTWVTNDANATTRDWIIAFWHHPPYSKGSHDSDSESGLITMRQEFNPILEGAGVDLVLCGHSHSYERSFLINGHFGLSGTFTNAMKVDGGSGRDPAPYQKPAGTAASAGAVYVVAGSSGQTSGGSLNHPAMYISLNSLGSLVIDVDGSRMDVKFLRETGAIGDYFTLVKGSAPPPLPAVTVSVPDANAAEAGPDPGRFRITRTGATTSALQVSFSLGGGAQNSTDYGTLTSPATIPVGASFVDVTVTPVDDSAFEGSESVVLTIASGSGYTVGTPSSMSLVIADNDPAPSDSDGDGLPDSWEIGYWGDITSQDGAGDPDGDGLTNAQEYAAGTHPGQSDTDGDGLPDGWEILYGLNPNSPADASLDADGDGYSNLQEFQGGSDPTSAGSVPGAAVSGGGGSGGCGATGLEAALLAGALAILLRLRF